MSLFRCMGWVLAVLFLLSAGTELGDFGRKNATEQSKSLGAMLFMACTAVWILVALAKGVH